MKRRTDSDGSAGSDCRSDDNHTSVISPQGYLVDGKALGPENSDIGPNDSNQSGDEEAVRLKKRIQIFSESSSESEKDTTSTGRNLCELPPENEYNSSKKSSTREKILFKSRLRKLSISGDDSVSEAIDEASINDESESRIKTKRNKLVQKFKSFHAKKTKKEKSRNESDQQKDTAEDKGEESHSSSGEATAINEIRQKIKQRTLQLNSSLYDPDTSDEESSMEKIKITTWKKERKKTKPTSPKPIRMSAKQAMENMQKIKSESNRMLREKDVSLPYHRPKALSLKDIMSRRRTPVTADGKALPIKMNEEQLKQYAQLLEQRQKEIIELCKSDTEEEEEFEKTENNTTELPEVASLNDTLYDDISKTEINSDPNVSQIDSKDTNCQIVQTGSEITGTEHDNSLENPCKVNSVVSNIDAKLTDLNVSGNNTTIVNVEPMSIDGNLEKSLNNEHERKVVHKNNSFEMELVYNDSIDENNSKIENTRQVSERAENTVADTCATKHSSEIESQLISLHYDTERSETAENVNQIKINEELNVTEELNKTPKKSSSTENNIEEIRNHDFSDDDMNLEDIDALIENAEIDAIQNNTASFNSPMLIKEPLPLTGKPRLIGAPGMVIDLDGTHPLGPKKLSGVELLKERYVYFAKLKTPEELERERERRIKPGMQHLKLKQELEDQIAEQRSLEWAKRLEDEKIHQKEINSLRGEGSDAEDDIDAMEAKLEEKEVAIEQESSESEEEEVEQEIVEKPRKRNPMVDDEAEESDCDEVDDENCNRPENRLYENKHDDNLDDDAGNEADESEDESSEESEESEEEQQDNPNKKSRILKAFEDSDDEETPKVVDKTTKPENNQFKIIESDKEAGNLANSQVIKNTQDEELHLAQKSMSEDLFTTSQESTIVNSGKTNISSNIKEKSFEEKELATQTFSILEATTDINEDFPMPDTLSIARGTQSYNDSLDAVVGMCSGSFSQTQNLVPASQPTATAAEVPESQVINDDVLALCTGQFYDNQFVSQIDTETKELRQDSVLNNINVDADMLPGDIEDLNKSTNRKLKTDQASSVNKTEKYPKEHKTNENEKITETKKVLVDPNLLSILDELNDPEFDTPKPKKYFVGDDIQDKENKQIVANQFKKKFTIDSDDESKTEDTSIKKSKKIKRKKLEDRALQISDDEEDDPESVEEYESDLEEEHQEQIVEYDSEENEVVVQLQNPKKKRKLGEFFEQEAELTSEDEWAGSGDEDEAGLDRMEREAGDDDTFNQNQLQRELGQIHMRDVLDQDKREVRLIQELLFEDGDLGGGSRQRKFRWKNADGEEETGTTYNEFGDTQEEEFESEEQWRKQRHEREMFLKSLTNEEDTKQSPNTTVNRTSIIKANLTKNTSNLFAEMNKSVEEAEAPVAEKKAGNVKDIPSPTKPFTIFQHKYGGSLLSRGRGALARLAALAAPLAGAGADDAPLVAGLKPGKGNFVFTSVDAPALQPLEQKVAKRKADSNSGTPKLVKKMRTEEKQTYPKSSLLDHMTV